jgi:hypothetical protein
MPDDKAAPPRPRRQSTSRSQRLAAALRANLRRRKAQARGRAGESKLPEATGEPPTDKPDGDTER